MLTPTQAQSRKTELQELWKFLTPQEREEILRIADRQPLTLKEFTKQAWHVVEPARPFISNWHVDVLAEHLTAVLNGEIKNLIINIPPRTTKSTLVSVIFPAWAWAQNPTLSWLCSSYAESLAIRDSVNCRRLIESDWYKKKYGHIFAFESDQNAKSNYKNTRGGARKSVGVATSVTGHGGDISICDDPNNVQEVESDQIRESVNEWYLKTFYSRMNDMNTARRIIIQQRTHERDVTGAVLQADLGFELLKIPFRYKGEKFVTSLGFSDPRETIDEVIDPVRFTEESAKMLEKALGTDASAQLQQDPIPKGGDYFSRELTEENKGIVTVLPNDLVLVRYWDKAFTAQGGAYTVGCLMGRDFATGDYYVVDIVRGQWAPYLRDQNILQTANDDAEEYGENVVTIHIEVEPGPMGRDSVNNLKKMLAPHTVWGDPAKEEKTLRAHGFNSQWEAGNVKLLKADWNVDYVTELQKFPRGTYKDQVDASSGAFNKLSKKVKY